MEWLGLIVLAFAVVGVVLTIRERRTGRGALVDETARDAPQTEADRERIRIEDHTIHR
ncbi:hypothetical protein [uncultured Tateyamaria sp.]|uniref:hypothetical protein n=1 Tax=uncultured Tateyamaria sp. TaxID=455651 RepID=UPI00261421F4|nr:hypothetical protein [uncultured Tateyamaria sp.]